MKTYKLIFLSLILFALLGTSCSSDEVSSAQWKLDNTNYFNHMNDSVGFVYNKPATQNGYGYYYKITTPGDQTSGSPALTDEVKVNYRGRLINGTIFDTTFTGNNLANANSATPTSFRVNEVVSGWTKNLMQMKVGEIRTIVIPQQLGYGALSVSLIPAYSTLRFEIQLISYH